MKKLLVIFTLLHIFTVSNAQQDAQFSQYMFNGLYINPAYAGYKEQAYLHSFYRSQWVGVEGAPQNMSLAADMVSNNGNVGLGLLFSHDKLGAQTNLSVYANYAYRLQVGRSEFSRLSFGLGFGIMQLGMDGRKLNPIENDVYVPSGMTSEFLPNARAGVFFANETFFAGFSADNLLAQHVQIKDRSLLLPKIKPHYYLTAGTLLSLSSDIKFKPSFLLKDDIEAPTSLDLSAFALFNERIWLGGFYRTSVKLYEKSNIQADLQKSNAMGLIAEVFATENIRIGYAFDYSLSAFKDYNYGSHEISIGFALGRVRKEGPKCYF